MNLSQYKIILQRRKTNGVLRRFFIFYDAVMTQSISNGKRRMVYGKVRQNGTHLARGAKADRGIPHPSDTADHRRGLYAAHGNALAR